jgi:hypothetical protein
VPRGPSCSRCGRTGTEIAWSDRRRADVCERCLPPVSLAPEPRPKLRPAPRPRPTRYARFHDRVYGALRRLTGSEVFLLCDGTGRMFSYCPACRDGVVIAQLHDLERPTVTITSSDWPGHCSNGCSEEFIGRVMFG